jgi:hypothetical protein
MKVPVTLVTVYVIAMILLRAVVIVVIVGVVFALLGL